MVAHGVGGAAARVLVASNRGPVSYRRAGASGEAREAGASADGAGAGALVARRGGGGLVSGLSAIGPDAGALWVCSALSHTDREAAREAARRGRRLNVADTGGQAVRMLDIDPVTFADAYNGIANSTLWFIH